MLARENAERLGLVDRVRFLRSNLLESVEPDFDMIAANLPYISTEDRQNLSREVLQDRKSTRLNSSHSQISYAVFCLKKQTQMSSRGNASSEIEPQIVMIRPPSGACHQFGRRTSERLGGFGSNAADIKPDRRPS